MKFKKIMLITLLLLTVLTIGVVSAADDAGALAADDAGDGDEVKAPVDDASMKAEENVNLLENDAENYIEFGSETISDNTDCVVTFSDSDTVAGSTVSVLANGTTVYSEIYSGYVESIYGRDFKGRYDGYYNITAVYEKSAGNTYSLSKMVYFDNIYNADFSDLNASDFNVIIKNTTFDVEKDLNKEIFSFTCPEGMPQGIIVLRWGSGYYDNDEMYLFESDAGSSKSFCVYNLNNLEDDGVYDVTIYFEDYDDNSLELAKCTLNVTKIFDAEEFIELYKDKSYSETDEIIYVHEISGSKLNGPLTIYYNGSQVFYQLFYGERAGMLINSEGFTGMFNGTCTLTVVYEREADGKKYSKYLTVDYVNPVIHKSLTPEEFNMTIAKEVDINDVNATVISFTWPESTTTSDKIGIDIKGSYESSIYKKDGETDKKIKFEELYIFEPGSYDLTISYYKNGNKVLKIANGTLIVTKTYTASDFIELYEKTISSSSDYVTIIADENGLNGTVTILSDGTQVFNKKLATGTNAGVWITPKNLTTDLKGQHNIKVTYNRAADGKEYTRQATVTFPNEDPTPTIKNSTITVSDVVLDYGTTTTVDVTTEGATGITAKIDGADASVDGFKVAIPILDAGNHTLSITTIPDTNYATTTKEAAITINPVDSSADVNDVVLDYGSTTNVTVTVKGAEGFTAKIDGKDAEVKDNEVVIPVLDVGTHTLSITTIADKNHKSVTKNASITINKVDSSVIVPDITFDYGSSGTSTVTGFTDITASVNNEKAIVEVNGNVITVSGLDAGSYTMTVKGLDSNKENMTKAATVTVNKLKSRILFNESSLAFDYGSSGSIDTVVLNGKIGKVSVLDHSEAVIAVNGNTITVSNLNPGSYIMSVTSEPDENYDEATENVTVKVNKIGTAVSASKITVVYGASKNIVVTLKDSNGNPLKDQTVSVTFNNVAYSGVTNENGQASIAITKTSVTPKTYSASIEFAGDDTYLKSTGTASIEVKKATPKLTAKAKTLKRSDKQKKYTVTLKTNLNKAMKSAKVTIKVNKKTYTAKTNSKGVATFKLTKLTKKGKYTATVKFAATKYYNAKSAKVKITVK